MEARFLSAALIASAFLSLGATYPTQNFIITAATPQLAREIGDAAEAYRLTLARDWLGHTLPPWNDPCPITARVAPHLGAGGATTFMFAQGRPFGWRMDIQGSRERLLDSVLPHEITHMIFATHFGRPLPRWADEGAATTVEHAAERDKQHQLLYTFLTTGRGIPFNQMFAMKEYPSDVLPLYSQGYSLARYLIAQGGRQKFVAYVGDGMQWHNWTAATQRHYGLRSLSELQVTWLAWVRQGCPDFPLAGTLLAAQPAATPPAEPAVPPPPVAAAGGPYAAAVAAGPASPDRLATAPADGWRVRPRPSAGAKAPAAGPDAASAGAVLTAAPLRERLGSEPLYRSLSRPQEPGQPQPTALEWTSLPSDPYQPILVPQRSATSAPGDPAGSIYR